MAKPKSTPRHRNGTCSLCGTSMQRRKGSADEQICRPCRAGGGGQGGHGTGAYRAGCRCGTCRDAKAQANREYSAKREHEGNPIVSTPHAERRRVDRACEWCRLAFSARADGRQRFCSLVCANGAQGGSGKRRRARERHRVEGRMGTVRWRALRRAKAALELSGGNQVWVQGACAVCGDAFVSPGAASRYCSQGCRTKNRNRAFGLSWLDRMALFARDGWTCQICSEPVDYTADHRSDWYPTLDHIVPRSHGGSDELSNLRTAHRWCNSVRGDLSHYTDADLAA